MIHLRREIFTNFEDMMRQMERFMDHVASARRPLVVFTHPVWQPHIDVYENPEGVVVLVELAGVSRDQVEISIENDALTVRGQRKDVLHGRKERCYVMEISYGPFERSIPLPGMVDAERAIASYVNGFLEIVLPRAKVPPSHKVIVGQR